MTQLLEAKVAFLHIAGGGSRITSPPGTLAENAPRRAARGRSGDLLFINLAFDIPISAAPGLIDHLARLAADTYFGTPGSVTSALRESAAAVNDHLVYLNRQGEKPDQIQARMLIGVLRRNDLYLGQCGLGQAILVRPGQVTRLSSDDANQQPLGATLAPTVRFHHLEVRAEDLFILTTAPPDLWSEATLSGLTTLDPDQALERLAAASNQDLTGLLARILPTGEGKLPTPAQASSTPEPATVQPSSIPERRRSGSGVPSIRSREGFSPRKYLDLAERTFHNLRHRLFNFLSNIIARIAPGLAEPLHPDAFSRRLLVSTAVAVPLVVVAVAALVYFRRGRVDQFEQFLGEASAAVATALARPEGEEVRSDWEQALRLINQAEEYGENTQSEALRQQAQEALDALDRILRLDFTPLVSGGFGSESRITALAASSTDIYVLDAAQRVIRHAWGTPERGYEIDSTFRCLGPEEGTSEMGLPIDIVVQTEPGALGVEGVVAVDEDGTLLYCAPDRQPSLAQLAPPDIGWGRIAAIDVFGDNLYVLDPSSDAVWIYEAIGGFFTGNPALYFVEEIRELRGAIDLSKASDELVVLYADGHLDRCRRFLEPNPQGGERIRVDCEPDSNFQDDRPNREATAQIPGALPVEMVYSPPPEPSLYFLDSMSNSVFHYSLRLVYQGQYLPKEPLEGEVTAMTLGPPNDIYLAVGTQVYHATPRR